ncbi:MAG: SDR family oxidoreductase [Microcoleaceae cyanobacterium]
MTNNPKATIIGCGYVGSLVACIWSDLGLDVTVTTTTPERVSALESIANHVIVLQGNNPEKLTQALQGQEIVLVTVGAKQRDSGGYRLAYLETAQTLATVLPRIPTVQQVIYTSSYALYGDHQGATVDETTPTRPMNENGQVLQETEQVLLQMANDQLKVCILRLGGIYGPDRELLKIWRRVAGTTRPGDGSDPTNWIHRDDIAGMIEFVRRYRLSGIYNVVDDSELTLKELIDAICEKYNLEKVTWDTSQASNRPYRVRVSNQKLHHAGYQLLHPQMEI